MIVIVTDASLAIMRSDPLVGMPKGEEWVAELERRVASGALRGTRPDLDRMHFDTMQEDAIDKWLDRCEDVLLKNRDVGRGKAISSEYDLTLPGQHLYQFPIHRLPRPAPTSPTSWADFLAAAARDPVRTYTPRGADLPLMPGEGYRSHDAADVTGTLPRALETVLSAAADVVGVPVTMVASTVELFERRMEAMRPRREYQSVESRAVRRVRGGALRESRSLDRALNELR